MINRVFAWLLMTCLLIAFLSACATLSESECKTGAWSDVGLGDGQSGKRKSLADHNQACEEYGIEVNRDEYDQGYEQGLEYYCTFEMGAYVGSQGDSYNNVCPPEAAAEFLDAYRINKEYYEVNNDIDHYRSDLSSYQSKSVDKKLTEDERKNARKAADDKMHAIEHLQDKREFIKRSITVAEIDHKISKLLKQASDLNSDSEEFQSLMHEISFLEKRIDHLYHSQIGLAFLVNKFNLGDYLFDLLIEKRKRLKKILKH